MQNRKCTKNIIYLSLTIPASITYFICGIVTEASAMLVASTTFLTPGGDSFQTCNCFAAGNPAYNGQTFIGGPDAS